MQSQQITWNPQAGWTPIGAEPEKSSLSFILARVKRWLAVRAIANFDRCFRRPTFWVAAPAARSTIAMWAMKKSLQRRFAFIRRNCGWSARTSPMRGNTRSCGETIGRALSEEDLAGVFLLSDGLNVNGSELVNGLVAAIGPGIPLTGGLAGDGADFAETLRRGRLRSAGAPGGRYRLLWQRHRNRAWQCRRLGSVRTAPAGDASRPETSCSNSTASLRLISTNDIWAPKIRRVFPALPCYSRSRSTIPGNLNSAVVRTVLAVDHQSRSMTFAGDVPQGWTAQLMRGNFDRLAEGAADAARQARNGLNVGKEEHQFSILVSCIGRRLLMGQRASDETEAAGAELGPDTLRLGFYSYGEISPHAKSGICGLHNQTMTVTSFAEVET